MDFLSNNDQFCHLECKRSENNHYENMRYPNLTTELPMYCQYWDKNKYADDWFIIHRTTSVDLLLKLIFSIILFSSMQQ